jgi:hypothetical protein
MSILADSLGSSYPFGVSPSMQEDAPTPAAAPFLAADDGQRQSKEVRVPEKPPTTAVRRDETPLSDHPADGVADPHSGLVDFELFEQAMQSPGDDNPSRNNQASADLDANALLSSYQQLLDAQTLSTPLPFHPVF